ncbi:MAG TPA: alpha/beta hydrolase [Myxococcota bacterium]|jgi:pimeloyl-ACP methyl ester carboxylesterase|nr:alpha/beta hydrolase [Myxococcota bacterium]
MSTIGEHGFATVNGFRMHYVRAGSGPPLVLVHGWPQTWYEWRKVMPRLADRFTLIAPDLRGLGDSEKPAAGYDKRTIASDVRALLAGLGIERIGLVGHDWGVSVSYFLAYDNPGLVDRLMVLDMYPGIGRLGGGLDFAAARKFWHIAFHAGRPDVAARIVGHDVEGYLSHFFTSPDYTHDPSAFAADDIAEYVRCYSAPGALRAGFEYYRAGLEEDLVNLAGCTRKLDIPVRAFGSSAFLGDVTRAWRRVAEHVDGGEVPACGHFIPEEKPDFVAAQILEFFATSR